jgi:hypothetical protein
MSDLKAQLSEAIGDAEWSSLIPHVQRDALIIVNPGLDLIEVGFALANDDVSTVQYWISERLIYKPSPDQLSLWNTEPTKQFSTLIVQPFVLVSAE